jgi:hypothetical protein
MTATGSNARRRRQPAPGFTPPQEQDPKLAKQLTLSADAPAADYWS